MNISKKSIMFFCALWCCFSYFAFAESMRDANTASNVDDISGIYANPLKNNESYIEIFEKNGKYYGVVLAKKIGRDDEKDIKNPNKALRERPVFGSVFLWNLTLQGDTYRDGRIYHFDDGKEYYASIKKAGDNLKLRGSKDKKGVYGRTVEWRKVDIKDLPPHVIAKRVDVATIEVPE